MKLTKFMLLFNEILYNKRKIQGRLEFTSSLLVYSRNAFIGSLVDLLVSSPYRGQGQGLYTTRALKIMQLF